MLLSSVNRRLEALFDSFLLILFEARIRVFCSGGQDALFDLISDTDMSGRPQKPIRWSMARC